jgi:hypothetical protein
MRLPSGVYSVGFQIINWGTGQREIIARDALAAAKLVTSELQEKWEGDNIYITSVKYLHDDRGV